jgi:hypothetical protein
MTPAGDKSENPKPQTLKAKAYSSVYDPGGRWMRKHSIQIYLPLSPASPEKTQYKIPAIGGWEGEGERETRKEGEREKDWERVREGGGGGEGDGGRWRGRGESFN